MSSAEVTITLGRSRLIVKRKSLNSAHSLPYRSKRQRAIAIKEIVGRAVDNGLRLDRNDLRHKLIQKRLSSASHISARGKGQRAKIKRDFSGIPLRSSIKSYMLQLGPQSQRDICYLRDPYVEATRGVSWMNSMRKFTCNGNFKQSSPARPTYHSSCLSPPTYRPDMQKMSSIRSINPVLDQHTFSNEFPNPLRSTIPAHLTALTESLRAQPVDLVPSPNCPMHRSSFMDATPMTVTGFLNSLGVGKYVIYLKAEEVDMSALKQMGENDLKDLGIPMGPRKKILQGLSTISRRQLPKQLQVS